MEARYMFEVKALRAQRLSIAKRPKSAHVSHRGELVLGLSPRANRACYGVNDSPTKYQAESRRRVVQRYCVLDHTTVPAAPSPPEEDTTTTREGAKCKITKAGSLQPRQATVKSLRQPSFKNLHQKTTPPSTAPSPTTTPSTTAAPTIPSPSDPQDHAANGHTETLHEVEESNESSPDARHKAWIDQEPTVTPDTKVSDAPVARTGHSVDADTPKAATPVAPTAALCLSAYQARKQAEESARRLANRLSFLNMEKARAEHEAERLHVEFYREQDAKIAFERQKQERAARADQEQQRVAAMHSKALALQSRNRSIIQQQAANLAQQKRQAALRVKQQQKALEEDKKAREASVMQEKLKTKHSVVCQHERTKRQRQLREKLNKERLERAQGERLRKELEREKMAQLLVAKMQAQEHTLKTMLEFQEHQQRIDMQRCFDMESCAIPDRMTP